MAAKPEQATCLPALVFARPSTTLHLPPAVLAAAMAIRPMADDAQAARRLDIGSRSASLVLSSSADFLQCLRAWRSHAAKSSTSRRLVTLSPLNIAAAIWHARYRCAPIDK